MLIPVKIHRIIQTLVDMLCSVENECIMSSKMANWAHVRIKNAIALSQTQNSLETSAIQRKSHTKYMEFYKFSIGSLIQNVSLLSTSLHLNDCVALQF